MKTLLGVFLVLMFSTAAAHPLPDSLIARVVLLERVAYETDDDAWIQPSYPQATGFFMRFAPTGTRYLVTAKHALYRPDTVIATQIHAVGVEGNEQDILLTDYRTSRSVLQHQDPLVDLLLIDDSGNGKSTPDYHLPAFRATDIVSKAELESLRKGLQAFYIERWPDTSANGTGIYRLPEGTFLRAARDPIQLLDPVKEFAFKADFTLRIPGRPGVSGSPVVIRQGGRYRLLGVISAFGLDANKDMTSVAYCTGAYRILETVDRRSGPAGN